MIRVRNLAETVKQIRKLEKQGDFTELLKVGFLDVQFLPCLWVFLKREARCLFGTHSLSPGSVLDTVLYPDITHALCPHAVCI